MEQKKFKEFTTQIEDLSNELKEKNKQVGCLKSEGVVVEHMIVILLELTYFLCK